MAPRKPPWAQRQQPETGPPDQILIRLARHMKPPVGWWWGRTWREGRMRLVCYVCGETLSDITPSYALSEEQVAAVMAHRQWEIERMRPRVHRTIGGIDE